VGKEGRKEVKRKFKKMGRRISGNET